VKGKEYTKVHDVKGNTPNMAYRYLELRRSPKEYQLFVQHFPEYLELFNEIEKDISELSKCIFYQYLNMYVKKRDINPCYDHVQILIELHSLYLSKKVEKVTRSVVDIKLSRCHPKRLAALLGF